MTAGELHDILKEAGARLVLKTVKAIAENHILRFYADALHLGIANLQKRFRAIGGIDLPEPGDPGDPAWWAKIVSEAETGAETAESAENQHRGSSSSEIPAPRNMSIAQAHTVLGLSLNATPHDIELAYQKLARVFQVNQEEAIGEKEVSQAHARFRKIKQAYHLLTR